jgi:hypothetical protein
MDIGEVIVLTCGMFEMFVGTNLAKAEIEHAIGKFVAALILHLGVGIIDKSLPLWQENPFMACYCYCNIPNLISAYVDIMCGYVQSEVYAKCISMFY